MVTILLKYQHAIFSPAGGFINSGTDFKKQKGKQFSSIKNPCGVFLLNCSFLVTTPETDSANLGGSAVLPKC